MSAVLRSLDEKTFSAILLALGIVVALVVSDVAELFKPFALPALFCVVVFSLLPHAHEKFGNLFQFDPIMRRTIFWQMFIIPSAVLVFGIMSGINELYVSLLLISCTASSVFSARCRHLRHGSSTMWDRH